MNKGDERLERAYSIAARGHRREAIECLMKNIQEEPNVARHYFNMGSFLGKDYSESVDYLKKAVELDPSLTIAYKQTVQILTYRGEFEEAYSFVRKYSLVRLGPYFRAMDLMLSWYSGRIGPSEYEAVMVKYRDILRQDMNHEDCITIRRQYAIFCKFHGYLDEALRVSAELVAELTAIDHPDARESILEYSHENLLAGNVEKGFALFAESHERMHAEFYQSKRPSKPTWRGESVGSLMVQYRFCGLGDFIMFIRCLYDVSRRVRDRIFLIVDPRLSNLIKYSDIRRDLPKVLMVQSTYEHIIWPEIDAYAEVTSLVRFTSDMTLRPFLRSYPWRDRTLPPELMEPRRKRLRAIINARGNQDNKILDERRRLPAEEAAYLARATAPFVEWFSVMINLPEHERVMLEQAGVTCLGDRIDKNYAFEDTIPIMHAVDLVITVDTSLVHIAGTMQLPTWVLCSVHVDFRWGLRGQSPWYPDVKIFRERETSKWREVVVAVADSLAGFEPKEKVVSETTHEKHEDNAVFVSKSVESQWEMMALRNIASPERRPTWYNFYEPHKLAIVLIEFRVDPWMRPVLDNIAHVYGNSDASLTVVHGIDNASHVEDLVKDWKGVHLWQLPVHNVDIPAYNAILTSLNFWNHFEGHINHVLIMQTDALLRRRIDDAFFEYDYVGAAWDWYPCGSRRNVGNGGLSLRSVDEMIRVSRLRAYSPAEDGAEDIFFSKHVRSVAPQDIAKQFSVETQFCSNPCGMHKPYHYLPMEWVKILLADIPGCKRPALTQEDYREAIAIAGGTHKGFDVKLDLMLAARDSSFEMLEGLHVRARWQEILGLVPQAGDPCAGVIYAEALWRTGQDPKRAIRELITYAQSKIELVKIFALASLGYAFYAMKNFNEARSWCRRYMEAVHGEAKKGAMLLYGHVLLADNKWKQGFEYYCETQRTERYRHWEGERVDLLVIINDKGIGDQIMFSRFIPQACKRAKRVILKCFAETRWLFQRNLGAYGCDNLEVAGELFPIPQEASVCHCMYLPKALGVCAVKDFEWYPTLFSEIKRELPVRKRFLVHLRGSASNPHLEYRRCVPPEALEDAIASTEGAEWISVMKDPDPATKRWMRSWGVRDKGDDVDISGDAFVDTVGILKTVTCVVSSDTSIVHLAASMGVPVVLLLGDFPEWRWAGRGKWYGGVSVVRRKKDWRSTGPEVTSCLLQYT